MACFGTPRLPDGDVWADHRRPARGEAPAGLSFQAARKMTPVTTAAIAVRFGLPSFLHMVALNTTTLNMVTLNMVTLNTASRALPR